MSTSSGNVSYSGIKKGKGILKISNYIAEFIRDLGVKNVYVVQGGAVLHLIDSIDKCLGIDYVCMQHEQAAAMAADAQARITGNFGAAFATSGPGATNLITGICSAYYDSIPVIFITGQVATFRNKADTGVRQIGFQETEIVSMVKSITNYAVYLDKAENIRHELEKACFLATHGRPGPVLIDIPDNLQREEIDPAVLSKYEFPEDSNEPEDSVIKTCIEMIGVSKRPVIIYGAGIYASGAQDAARKFLQVSKLPLAPTWAAADILPFDDPSNIGTFGTHGTRYGNFAVQNADLILSIGCRLDTKATGSPVNVFARGAKKIMVDIDVHELKKFEKFGLKIDLPVQSDAGVYLEKLIDAFSSIASLEISEWLQMIQSWKSKYPICQAKNYKEVTVNPYVFVKELSGVCDSGERIVIDTGCCVAWMMQAFEFKDNQRLLHDWNNTAMGWALPASIGVAMEFPGEPVICVIGDGSFQMNIQELATIIKNRLPIKIFVLNNHGYSMIQQTQDQWLQSRYTASSEDQGLPGPDFLKIASAYGFRTINIAATSEIKSRLADAVHCEGPVFCNVEINSQHRVVPQAKFGFPNEDQEPLLDREEFLNNMIVKPLEISLAKF